MKFKQIHAALVNALNSVSALEEVCGLDEKNSLFYSTKCKIMRQTSQPLMQAIYDEYNIDAEKLAVWVELKNKNESCVWFSGMNHKSLMEWWSKINPTNVNDDLPGVVIPMANGLAHAFKIDASICIGDQATLFINGKTYCLKE